SGAPGASVRSATEGFEEDGWGAAVSTAGALLLKSSGSDGSVLAAADDWEVLFGKSDPAITLASGEGVAGFGNGGGSETAALPTAASRASRLGGCNAPPSVSEPPATFSLLCLSFAIRPSEWKRSPSATP